ncbi:hypothetical protein [Chitiniphilus shinanonensis]|uniref:hypothetical protein n=1 Tax=Chitiniphilus shinanonensis TaxID=553088 RepID=UPI0030431890
MARRGVLRSAWDFLFAAGDDQLTPTPEPEQQPDPDPVRLVEAAGRSVDVEDDDAWRRLSGDTDRDLAPMTHERMQKMALYLWESNVLANRIIELPLAFLLAEGVSWSVQDTAMQAVLDRFWRDPINQMDLKLPKKVRELALYGEQCYPVFANEMNGDLRLGYLNPRHITTVVMDPDNPEQAIGIVTNKDRKNKTRRYRVIVNGPETVFTERTQEIRATFTDGDAFWFTVNDLSDGARGRSDLLAQADWLDGYDMFLFGELDRAQFLRSFVWDVTIAGADQAAVDARAAKIAPPRPNSVRVHNESEKWQAVTPSLQAGDTSDTARLMRNHVLGGATLPEHWYGGGGDVNRSTAGSMDEPTFKSFTMRQQILRHILREIGRYVLRQHLLAQGKPEPEPNDERLDVAVTFPEMVARDTSRYAAALQQVIAAVSIAVTAKLMTEATAIAVIAAVASRLGVEIEPADELAAALEEETRRAEADAFQTPPEDEVDPAEATP